MSMITVRLPERNEKQLKWLQEYHNNRMPWKITKSDIVIMALEDCYTYWQENKEEE